MKEFIKPEMEIIVFDTADIIVTSNTDVVPLNVLNDDND